MTKLGKFWTGAVAYVSLLVGAGLSVAGNLADTYRTRGADVDGLDKVMAAAWPILVILAIEMFVSPRWSSMWMFQVWRWIGCLAVGGMAMVVSWTHLHDLMASRNQLFIVSVVGPLAIDGMAIMATGLILSTGVRGQVRTSADTVATSGGKLATWSREADTRTFTTMSSDLPPGMVTDMKASAIPVADIDGRGHWADLTAPDTDMDNTPDMATDNLRADTDKLNGLATWAQWSPSDDRALMDMAEELRTAAPPLPRRTRTADGTSRPAEFADMVAAWDPEQLPRADLVKLTAAHFDVSTRTVRRWLAATLGEPISGAGS